MRFDTSSLTHGCYSPVETNMPADSATTEKYVVYSTDGSNEDNRSLRTERSDSVTFRDPAYVDLTIVKDRKDTASPLSTVHSTISTDKWGSYWSKRERCCCFWNFLLVVALAVLVSLVVLETKGLITLNDVKNDGASDSDELQGAGARTSTAVSHCTTTVAPSVEVCEEPSCIRATSVILSSMNYTADPCSDFFTYACGGFTERTHLSWDSPRKRRNPDIVYETYIQHVADGLSEDIQPTDSTEVQAIKRIFISCKSFSGPKMDQVLDVLDMFGGFEFGRSGKTGDVDLTELTKLSMQHFGVSPLFDMEVTRDGKIGIFNQYSDALWTQIKQSTHTIKRYRFLKPSDYIYRDENNDELMLAYKRYMGELIAHVLGINETERAGQPFLAMINDMYHLNVYMNRVLYSEESMDPTNEVFKCRVPKSMDYLQRQFNYSLSWTAVLSSLFINSSFQHNYTICHVSLTNDMNDVITSFPEVTLKRYFIFYVLTESDLFNLLPSNAPRFSHSKVDYSALFNRQYSGSDSDCARQISNYLPMYYVLANYLSGQFNDPLRQLFNELIASIEKIITNLYWMPSKQKQHLLTELSGLTMHLEWESTDDLLLQYLPAITNDFFPNMQIMVRYSQEQFLRGKVQFPFNEKSYSIVSLKNKELVVPLAALYLPVSYSPDVNDVWYGALGTTLAQTISELFDVDALLRLLHEERLDLRVALTFARRQECLTKQYTSYTLLENGDQLYQIKSDLTRSADFKDHLALRVVYNAYSRIKHSQRNILGLQFTSDQLFFISYAQSMCEKSNTRGIFKYYIDTENSHHSPGKFRVLGSLSHFRKFADAFSCPVNSPMNPLIKCNIF